MVKALQGQRAVVTGGGKGIGRAIAHRLTEAGADIVLLGRDLASLKQAAAECDAAIYQVDLTDRAAITRTFEQIGPVDILINNAGAAISRPFLDHDSQDWDDMLGINLMAAVATTKEVLEGMIRRKSGRIVNVASTAGLKGYRYSTAYCAAKHAVVGLTRALALETARTGVTVNAICPGFTNTALFERAVGAVKREGKGAADKARQALTDFNPQGRIIEPQEVAEAVSYLCGAKAASLTGLALPVCGGEVM